MLLARGAGRRPVLASPAMVASSRCCCACSLRTSPMRRPGARCTRLGAVRSDRNAAIMRIRAASQLATPARFIRFCLERVPPILGIPTLSSFPPFPFFFVKGNPAPFPWFWPSHEVRSKLAAISQRFTEPWISAGVNL